MADQPKWGRRQYPVDIIVRAYGNPEMTAKAVNSILATAPSDLYRLTVVENYSETEDSWANTHTIGVISDGEAVQHISLPTNMGAVRATNAGLMLAYLSPSKYVLIFDNDIKIPDGDTTWLQRWIAYFEGEQNRQVGAVGALSDYVAGFQQALRVPDTFIEAFKDPQTGNAGDVGPITVPWLISFACMYRKHALKAMVNPVAVWDERFEPGNSEDIDVSLRLREADYINRVAPDIFIHHEGSQTFKKHFDLAELLKDRAVMMQHKWTEEKLREMDAWMMYESKP